VGGLTVCADDFGLTPGICSGILECLAGGRISATSCMTARTAWREWAAALRPFGGAADVGLHFTLTDHEPAGPAPILAPDGRLPSLSRLVRLSLTRRLPRSEVRDQLTRQLDAFEERFGSPPAHLDGHHHVHQLPGVREIVVETLRLRYGARAPYVRITGDTVARVFRRGIAVGTCLATGLAGAALRALARRAGVPTNEGFSGIYAARRAPRAVPALFDRFVRAPGPRMLVMCHPGHSGADLARIDRLTSQRDAELAFLLSDRWPELLSRHGLRLGPLPRGRE
jgi:predicted glycoside hydrolase/deacetylase ChbG (UPF0249 family)